MLIRFGVALKSTETTKSQLCSWMNVAKSYSYLFYTSKSLPGCFCSVILLTAKYNAVFNEILLTAKIRLFLMKFC